MAAGAEEPNAIMQLGSTEATQVPNVRATQQELFDGLVSGAVNGWPSVDTDLMSYVGKVGGKMMPPGFYYKTFMFPGNMWETYEKFIRKAAGLGRTSLRPTQTSTIRLISTAMYSLWWRAGRSCAALTAARSGARVILADEQSEFGGSLLSTKETLDGEPAEAWVSSSDELAANKDVMYCHGQRLTAITTTISLLFMSVVPTTLLIKRQAVGHVSASIVFGRSGLYSPPVLTSGHWCLVTTMSPAAWWPTRYQPISIVTVLYPVTNLF